MPRRSAAVVTIVALALAGPVRAQEPAVPVAQEPVVLPVVQEPAPPTAYDTVVLRDGSVLRGTILELHPEREVVIAMAGGTRTIAWQDIASTRFAGAAALTSPSGPVPEAQGHVPADSIEGEEEVAPGPSRPRIFIELTRPADVHLLEAAIPPAAMTTRMSRAAYFAASRSVCRAPCGRVVDGRAGYPFYFGGDRVMPSRAFFLKDLEGEYVARVRPGRWGLMAGGAMMAGFGYAGTLSGGVLVGITRDRELRTIGGVVLGVGLALLIAGVTMAVHGVTRYRLERRR